MTNGVLKPVFGVSPVGSVSSERSDWRVSCIERVRDWAAARGAGCSSMTNGVLEPTFGVSLLRACPVEAEVGDGIIVDDRKKGHCGLRRCCAQV